MKVIHFEQFTGGSTQKSIITGMAGFGVRTKSQGLSDAQAEELFTRSYVNYRVPTAIMATEEMIAANPDMSSVYPPLYTFSKVTLSSGDDRYVVARTIYVGIDYGYFAGLDDARRAGSNYLVHALVFDELPPVSVIVEAMRRQVFMPHNTICSPSNSEICDMLLGDPQPLPSGDVDVDEDIPLPATISTDAVWLAIALLQAHANMRKGDNSLMKEVMVKIPSDRVEALMEALSWMPQELTTGLFFQANPMLTSGVVEGMRMVIVNEKNNANTNDDFFVTVDLLGDEAKSYNIDNHLLFSKMREAAANGCSDIFFKIMRLMASLDPNADNDEQLLYTILMLSSTDAPMVLSDIDESLLTRIIATPLTDEQSQALWAKVNKALADALASEAPEADKSKALDLIASLSRSADRLLTIDITQLLDDDDKLYGALNCNGNAQTWEQILRLYFGERLTIAFSQMVERIMQSPLSDHCALASALFPLERMSEEWIGLFNVNEQAYAHYSPLLDGYLSALAERDVTQALNKVNDLSPDVAAKVNVNPMVDKYLDQCLTTLRPNIDMLNGVMANCRLSALVEYKIKSIGSIMEGKAPSTVDSYMAKLTPRITKDTDVMVEVLKAWLKDAPKAKAVADYITTMKPSRIEAPHILDEIWTVMPKKGREAYMMSVCDAVHWGGYKFEEVSNHVIDKELKRLFESERGLTKMIVRKLESLLFKSVIVAFALGLASCDSGTSRKTYVPVYTNLTCFMPDSVSRVHSTFRSAEGTDAYEYIHRFDKQGRLIELHQIVGADTTHTEYTYNKGKMASSTRNDVPGKLVYSGERLSHIVYKGTDKYGNTLNNEEHFSYENGRLHTITTMIDDSKFSEEEYFYYDNGDLKSDVLKYQDMTVEAAIDEGSKDVNLYRVYTGDSRKYSYNILCNYTERDSLGWTKRVDMRTKNKKVKSRTTLYRTCTREYLTFEQDTLAKVVVAKPQKTGNAVDDYNADLAYRYAVNNAENNAPSMVLTIILAILTIGILALALVQLQTRYAIYNNFIGEVQDNGMRRLWMFNYQPYYKVSVTIAVAFAAFIVSLLTIVLVGLIIYGVLWIFKFILLALIWVGWISLVIGGLALLGRSGVGCLPLIFGGVIVGLEEKIKGFAESCVEWGFQFMSDLNVFGWGLGLFTNFWDIILIVFLSPIILFAGAALLVMLFVFLLMGIEWAVMKIYSVRRPCPLCGSTKTPEYLVDGRNAHPVPLHPGIYGVFHHTNHDTNVKVPTMLFNGKGKLVRKCSSCGKLINADTEQTFGTEKHIGVVGPRSSGKSYMLYQGLHFMQESLGADRFSQMDAVDDTDINSKVMRIRANADIQTAVVDSYRAIQLIMRRKMNPIPYHLFFYDVAGEKFNQSSTSSKTAMEFYRNVQTVMFVVDPAMVDYSYNPPSEEIEAWLKTKSKTETYSIDGTLSTLKRVLETSGRKAKDIDFTFVITKSDMGYLEACGYTKDATPQQLEAFMCDDLGLGNVVTSAKGLFHSVNFYAVTVEETSKNQLTSLFIDTLKRMGVN